MAKYQIQSPSGEKFEINAPDNASQEDILSYAQKQFASQPKSYTTGEALTSAAANIIPDIGNVAVGIGKALIHPIDTATGIGKAAIGGLQNLEESGREYRGEPTLLKNQPLNTLGFDTAAYEQSKKETQPVASAIGKFYKDRYGSYEGFKRALAEHPAEVAADLSTVFTGAGALTKGTKLGGALTKAGEYTNPLKAIEVAVPAATKGIGNVLAGATGVTTGVGTDTVKAAYQAGKTGNQAFWKNLTKQAEPTEVLDTAKSALANMKAERNQAYRSGMVDIGNDKSILSFDKIDDAINSATGIGSYKGKITNQKAIDAVNEVKNAVNEWKKGNPTEYHTPEGIDALKQRVGSILEGLPYDSKARVAVQNIYDATKGTIKEQASTYDKVMKDYSEATDLVTQIQKSLSLNDKASVDTAMRKLQSLTRNNVQTNYGQRAKLAEELSKYGGEDIMPALAGQAMSEWSPRGIVGKGEDLAAIYAAFTNPSALAAFPAAMPRVVGTTAYGLGKAASAAGKVPKLPITVDQANKLALMLYQMNNPNQGEE